MENSGEYVAGHRDTKIGEDECPVCGYQFDAAWAVNDKDAVPAPGDYNLCINCAAWLVFEGEPGHLKSRQISHREVEDMDSAVYLSMVRADDAIREAWKIQGRPSDRRKKGGRGRA